VRHRLKNRDGLFFSHLKVYSYLILQRSQVVDLSAVGQDGGGTVAVEVVLVNGFLNFVVLAGKGMD